MQVLQQNDIKQVLLWTYKPQENGVYSGAWGHMYSTYPAPVTTAETKKNKNIIRWIHSRKCGARHKLPQNERFSQQVPSRRETHQLLF